MAGSAFTRRTEVASAGWRDDPAAPGMQRWHDGAAWTGLTRRAPARESASCECC
jgi:hypothetical protein